MTGFQMNILRLVTNPNIYHIWKSTFTGGGHQAEAAVLLLQQEHLHESEEADQTRQGRVSYDLFNNSCLD